MLKYRISIASDHPRGYKTSGAVAITASRHPMIDAARSLLAKGAEPHSTLAGSTYEGGMVSPVTLARRHVRGLSRWPALSCR
jgi:hypothetical protein